jgi:hypothetical protein
MKGVLHHADGAGKSIYSSFARGFSGSNYSERSGPLDETYDTVFAFGHVGGAVSGAFSG